MKTVDEHPQFNKGKPALEAGDVEFECDCCLENITHILSVTLSRAHPAI